MSDIANPNPRRQQQQQPPPATPSGDDERYRLLVQNITDYAIFMLDPEGRVTSWNEGAARIKGYAEWEILGQHFSIFFTPEDQRLGKPALELRAAEAEGRYEGEGYRVRKDGSTFWVNEILTAMRDVQGRLTGFSKISRDLTERKRAEAAVREGEERLRLLVENVRDYAIFMLDAEGRVVTWNPGAQRIFGYADQEIVGRDGATLFTPEDQASGEHAKELATALSEGRASDDRWQMRKGGERFWASGITTPLYDPAGGGLRGFAKVCRDLTERRRAEEERDRLLEREKAARLQAERAMLAKDEFLAVVSHELRTPLAAILLWSRLLRGGTVGGRDAVAAVEAIEQSAAAQQQLVEDLLDVSRMLSGRMRLTLQEMDLAPVIQAALDAVRPMAEAKGVEVAPSLGAGLGRVRADPARVQQVVWNLLNNAVKFTPRGGRVTVTLGRADGGALRVEVTDTGAGISPDVLPHVFEAFRQADSSSTRAYGGLGLGLSIARQLTELHGGTIRAHSAGAGRGATFTVDLPALGGAPPGGVAPAGTGPEAAAAGGVAAGGFAPVPVLQGLRVLVVEDDAHTRTVVQWLLEQCGAEVTAVASAAEALGAFQASLARQRFDVLVSDIGMPGWDGYDLLRQVRTAEGTRGEGRMPAVALTAYAREGDRERAMAVGFQLHLPKPVEPAALVGAVAGLTGRGPAR